MSMLDTTLCDLCLYRGSGFNLRDEMSEVKTVLEGDGEDGTKCHTLHRRYQSLVREYKRMERRLVECQKKQLEVCQPVCLCVECRLPACSGAVSTSLTS